MPTKRKEQPASTGNPLITNETLKKLYSGMLRARMLAEAYPAHSSPSPSQVGTEAALAGVISHLRPEDALSPVPDDCVAAFLKGQPLDQLATQVFAPAEGSPNGFHAASFSANLVPASADVRSQLSIANGIAVANKVRKQGTVSVAFFEDARGRNDDQAWIEALTFALAHKLPSLFVVLNKPASSSRKASAADYSARGQQLSLPVIPVDGNDVVAVYRVAQESIIRARQGSSPTLIEARLSPTAATASRRRANTNGHVISDTDPLDFMENYLRAKDLFSQPWKESNIAAFREELDSAFRPGRKPSRKQVVRT